MDSFWALTVIVLTLRVDGSRVDGTRADATGLLGGAGGSGGDVAAETSCELRYGWSWIRSKKEHRLSMVVG